MAKELQSAEAPGACGAALSQLEERLEYRFQERHLLEIAITHPSYRHESAKMEDDSQRLEFLGDAVLGLLIAEELYRRHPQMDEGLLTVMRSHCANGQRLAEIAATLNLGSHLRLGRGSDSPQQRNSSSLLADALEAVIGAAWLDGGYQGARKIFLHLFAPLLTRLSSDPWLDNPKGELQALAQSRFTQLPHYTCQRLRGPDHAPHYSASVTVAQEQAEGEGRSKQEAESQAASQLLARLKAHGF